MTVVRERARKAVLEYHFLRLLPAEMNSSFLCLFHVGVNRGLQAKIRRKSLRSREEYFRLHHELAAESGLLVCAEASR